MLKFNANASLAASNSKLGQKTYRVPGLGLQERLIVWGSANGAVAAMVLLGAGCYFAYDLISARYFNSEILSPLRLQLEGGAALFCGVIGLPTIFLQRKWRDLAVFVQGGVPLREAQERMNRLDAEGLNESLNDVAKDFLREHPAEVEAWRDDLKTYIDAQILGNPQVNIRLKLSPETMQAILEDRVAIARAMLSGAPLLMLIGRLLRLTGHAGIKRDRI